MPIESLATVSLRELIDGCDNDTAAKLLELVRVGLALAKRAWIFRLKPAEAPRLSAWRIRQPSGGRFELPDLGGRFD